MAMNSYLTQTNFRLFPLKRSFYNDNFSNQLKKLQPSLIDEGFFRKNFVDFKISQIHVTVNSKKKYFPKSFYEHSSYHASNFSVHSSSSRVFNQNKFPLKNRKNDSFLEKRFFGYESSQNSHSKLRFTVRVFPGGGPVNNQNDKNTVPSIIFLMVLGGLTLSGQLNWLYEGIFGFFSSLFVFVIILNIAINIASWLFEKNIFFKQTVGTCPSCGSDVKILDSFADENLKCPTCLEPFIVVDGKFVRNKPQFTQNYRNSKMDESKTSYDDVIDVEAKVIDKD